MRIVLAYSGGLDTSAAVHWLRETHRADVIAVTVDLGEGRALEAVRDRALAAGAVRAHVVDAREEFAREYVLRTLRADAVTETGQPAVRALGRPLLGHALVEIARIERAVAVAHGCDHDGADRGRLESALKSLNPGLTVMPVPTTPGPAIDVDVNLWGRSLLASKSASVPESMFMLTRPLQACPDEAAVVALAFEAGTPVSINGVAMPLLDLIQSLGTIAGAHGVGRVQTSEGWIEAPAAAVLYKAHRTLKSRVADPDLLAFAQTVGRCYADIVDRGGWFLPLREALDAFVSQADRGVTGTVRLRLFKSRCEPAPED